MTTGDNMPGGCSRCTAHTLDSIIANNRHWAERMRAEDPQYFERLSDQQAPEYLWIGCSDSRVPANQIMGLAPGEVFVQRNVGNQALHTDMNLMSCVEFAVKSLKVKSIILCGHYNCGAVKAALQLPMRTPGLVNCWISDIRECRNQHATELLGLGPDDQLSRLVELNVLRQVFNVCTSPILASAWAEGQEVHVYGVVYDLRDGILKKLAGPISGDAEYEHNLDAFVGAGIKVFRCPSTKRIRVSAPNAAGPASESGAGAAASPSAISPTPAELSAQLNSIALVDSIARHNNWTGSAGGGGDGTGAAAAARSSDGGGCGLCGSHPTSPRS